MIIIEARKCVKSASFSAAYTSHLQEFRSIAGMQDGTKLLRGHSSPQSGVGYLLLRIFAVPFRL